MTNLDKISSALSEWGFNIVKSVLPKLKIAPNSQIGHFMGMLGADPMTYNIWNELGFLAEPVLQTVIDPYIHKMLGSIDDKRLPELADKYVSAFIEQAKKKGSINVFGLELGTDAFEGLREILKNKMEEK